MPTYKTKYGSISFRKKSVKRNPPKRRKAAKKAPARKSGHTKKVGRWRVEHRARTVTCAGAKHSYKTEAAAMSAYKRINSQKACEGFVARYGTKKTKTAVLGKPKRPAAKKAKKGAKKARRANPPLTAAERRALQSILRRHGVGRK